MLLIQDLAAGYEAGPVARLPWLRVEPGQAALLLGASGSGKTSLLLAMAGLARIHAGVVELDDVNLAGLSRGDFDRFRGQRIGLIFQDLHLFAGLSVLDNVLLAPFAAGLPQNRGAAASLLERLGLADHAARPAERLSRGQAQRVAIARAMLLRPKLILADEPTASLDDAACDGVCDLLLAAARDTGAALLIATHDQRLKARIDVSVEAEPVDAPPLVETGA
jgi:putative ABC transport system ATP-binding protein